jgi:hypothetical protein
MILRKPFVREMPARVRCRLCLLSTNEVFQGLGMHRLSRRCSILPR